MTASTPPHERLSMQDAERILREAGLTGIADIAERYAIADAKRRNRWYRRLFRAARKVVA